MTHQHLNYLIQDTATFNIYMGLLYEKSKKAEFVVAKRNQLTSDLILSTDTTILRGSTLKEESIIGSSRLIEDKIFSQETRLAIGDVIKGGSIVYHPWAFYKELAEKKSEMYLFRDYLNEFIDLTEDVDGMFKELKTKSKTQPDSISKKEMKHYLNTAIDVVEYCADISYLFQGDIDFTNYLKIARNGNDLYYNMATKNYIPAVNNLATVLETIADEIKISASISTISIEVEQKVKETKSSRDSEIGKGFFGSRIYFSSEKQSVNKSFKKELRQVRQTGFDGFEDFSNKTSQILRYGTFMAHIIESDSVEEVKAAIEAAALPAGSYTIKRYSQWNIAVNSYLGASFGRERLNDIAVMDNDDQWSEITGVHAPVGVAISHRLWSTRNGGTWGSISLFASLIDLGAVAQFRLQNPIEDLMEENSMDMDTVQTTSFNELPDFSLKNILAPGGYLVWGIGNTPLAIGFGAQYGPALREIEVTTKDENGMDILEPVISESSAWRYGVFLSVDLPLLNLYTRRSKR